MNHDPSLLNLSLQPCFMGSLDGFSAIELSLLQSILSEVERRKGLQPTGNAGCKLMMGTWASASGSRNVSARIDIHPAQTTKSGLSARTMAARSLSYSVLAFSANFSLYGIKLLWKKISMPVARPLGGGCGKSLVMRRD